MYCKFVPTLAILSSLLIPVLSLAVPPRAELERRELAAGSVENLEAREPWGAAIKGISRVARGAHRAYKVRQRASSWSGNFNRHVNANPSVTARIRAAFDRIKRFIPQRRVRKRDLDDTEDLSARDFIEGELDLEARELGDSEEFEARSLVDEEDELVLRSLLDEIDDLDARSLFDDLDDLEVREIVENLDELD